MSKALREAALAILIDHERLEIEAAVAHVAVDPTRIEARLRAFKRASFGGDGSAYRDALRRSGVTEAELRDDIRWQLLARALRGVRVTPPGVTYAPGYEP